MFNVPVPRWEQLRPKRTTPRSASRDQIWLNLSLLLVIVVSPLLEIPGWPRLALSIVSITVIFAGVYAVSWNSTRLALGLLLGLPAAVIFWSHWLNPTPTLAVLDQCLRIAFFGYTLITILQYVFRCPRITINELFGAINVYILTGMTFGFFYALLNFVIPGAFRYPQGEDPSTQLFVYYSFSVLATLGIGDVVPVTPLARSLTIVELIIGVLYIAVLIGHLVGHRRQAGGIKIERVTSGNPASYVVGRFIDLPRASFVRVVLLVAFLNFATSTITILLGMPFYLDSWATSLGTIIAGVWAGLCGGIIYNMLMAVTFWGPDSIAWALSSSLVAIGSWYFWNKGWINIHRPLQMVTAGVSIGICNSFLVMAIQGVLGKEATLNTTALRRDLHELFQDTTIAQFGEQLLVEMMDKTVSLSAAAVALFVFGEAVRRWEERRKGLVRS